MRQFSGVVERDVSRLSADLSAAVQLPTASRSSPGDIQFLMPSTNNVELPFDRRSPFGAFSEEDLSPRLGELADAVRKHRISEADITSAYASVSNDRNQLVAIATAWRELLDGNPNPRNTSLYVESLYLAGEAALLAETGFSCPAYDVFKPYAGNVLISNIATLPSRPQVTGTQRKFLGHDIGFPIGVAASPLTDNARYIERLAANGFNVFTYRTVRSREVDASSFPNWVRVLDNDLRLPVEDKIHRVEAEPFQLEDKRSLERPESSWAHSTANFFGVPSLVPEQWRAGLEAAINALGSGQLVIASVIGEDYANKTSEREIAADFARTALDAQVAGAPIVELNLSAPNPLRTASPEVAEPISAQPGLANRIIDEVRNVLDPGTKIAVKLAYMSADDVHKAVDDIGAGVDAIAGINAVRAETVRRDGRPTFASSKISGVSGHAIRDLGLDFVRSLAAARFDLGLTFEIIGMGGVTDPESFRQLHDAGAAIVQSASGVFANPLLAYDCIAALGDSLTDQSRPYSDPAFQAYLSDSLLAVVMKAPGVSEYDLAMLSRLPYGVLTDTIDGLLAAGAIREPTNLSATRVSRIGRTRVFEARQH